MGIPKISHLAVCGFLTIVDAMAAGQVTQTRPGDEAVALQLGSSELCAQALREAGYAIDDPEQLKSATRHERAIVREAAMYVLGYRIRQDAIPVLREHLADSNVRNRAVAARVLGALGNRAGIPVLRRDLAALAPDNGAPDPNMKNLPGKDLRRAVGVRNERLLRAIFVAEVLSELEDPAGLQLAARLAMESDVASFRMDAVQVLTNLAKCSESVIEGQVIDPRSVLIAVIEHDSHPGVLNRCAIGTSAFSLPLAKTILEKLVASPHVSEDRRSTFRAILRYREAEARRQSNGQRAQPQE